MREGFIFSSAPLKGCTQIMAKYKNKKSAPQVSFPRYWYYMADRAIDVEDIKNALDSESYGIEIWKEAGVLEVEIEEKASIDLEECDPDLKDDYSNRFLQEHKVKTLFFVTVPTIEFAKSEAVMKKIVAVCGGIFCADTEDFMPQIM